MPDVSLYKSLAFPLLSVVDAETTHNAAIGLLSILQRSAIGLGVLKSLRGRAPAEPIQVMGLQFPNVLGVAAGFDKNARSVISLATLGFGHVEVGTFTPQPQDGNPKPRLHRYRAEKALVNSMGFPNGGVSKGAEKLRQYRSSKVPAIIGASLGKQKETNLNLAASDYIYVMERLYSLVDYFVVNISSPNTPGLRQLQTEKYIGDLMVQIIGKNRELAHLTKLPPRPVLVKIAPDITWEELDIILTVSDKLDLDGIVATNTASSPEYRERFPLTGGISGRPIELRSNEIIRQISKLTNGRLPIIGVGGIFSADDVLRKLDAGATLVQMYTGIVYEGPGVAGKILREIANHN